MRMCWIFKCFSSKWCFCQTIKFRWLMYPCLLESLIMGLLPSKCISSPPYFQHSKLRCIFSSVVIIIYIFHLFNIFYRVNVSGTLKYSSIPVALHGNCYIIIGGSIILVTYFKSHRRMVLFRSLAEVYAELLPKAFNRLYKLIYIKDIGGFVFLIGQSLNIEVDDFINAVLEAHGLYTTLVVFVMDMTYMNCVWVLNASFEKINESLLNVKKAITINEPHILRRIYHQRQNPLLLMQLKEIKRQHQQISNVLEMLNEAFGMHIMCTVTLSFVEITFSLYYYLLQYLTDKSIDLGRQAWYSYLITSVIYYSIKMIMIISVCDDGKSQAMKVGMVVHEVLVVTEDKQLREELQLFSLQALHRGNTFSAKGLTVDAKLLTGFVGSITTYLLILIQFLLATQPCGEKLAELTTTTESTTFSTENNR